jgi:hypothetical protein
MASWKKIIVSGSTAELAALQVDDLTSGQVVIGGGDAGNLTTTAINGTGEILATSGATDVSMTGSFSGSFVGDGSGLTGVVAASGFSISEGEGIVPFSYNGGSAQTVAVSGAADLSNNAVTKWDDTDGKFVNSSLTDDGAVVTGTSSIQLSGASSSLTGSFTGSFIGDGSGLTGMATTLSGSTDSGDFEVSLLTQFLTVQGTADEIEVSGSGQTITVGLPDNVTITGDLAVDGGDITSEASTFNLLNSGVSTINFGADGAGGATAINIGSGTSVTTVKDDLIVEGDLTVNGDLAYLNVTNLYVDDRFILLNSGSTSGDGGIIIQSGSADVGKAFFYDETDNRWGYADSISGSATGATPEAFAAMVVQNDGDGPETYQKTGNIRVTNTGEIFIYS